MVKAYLVVRMTGQINVPHWAKNTLMLLKLDKKFRATIVPAKDNTLGMLNRVKHYVSWQEVSTDIAKELFSKKGRKAGYKKISSEDLESFTILMLANIMKVINVSLQQLRRQLRI